MDRGLVTDEAASQILGFIVGLAVVTGSLAVTAYFMTTVPDTGPDRQTTELNGQTQRAIEVLTTTPGQPPDWHTLSDLSTDDLRRVGLLEQGTTHYAAMEKIEAIQNDSLSSDRILESWDINPNTHGLRIEGRVQTIGLTDPPGNPTFGVVNATAGPDETDWSVNETSKDAAKLYASVNPDYRYDEHNWTFGRETAPDTGLGNTVYDHAYFVETQLIPKMAGIEATYSTADHAHGGWEDWDSRRNTISNYSNQGGGATRASFWHVVNDGRPFSLPGSASEADDHVMTVAWRRDSSGSDNSGFGHWRVSPGGRSTALLGEFDASDASSAEINFYHRIKVNDSDDNFDTCQSLSDTDCAQYRPSIMFWNTTGTDHWSRISKNSSCTDDSGWKDIWADGNDGWSDTTVDLCEAVENTDDKLWLSLFWDTSCIDSSGNNETCNDDGSPEEKKAVGGWFVDNINVTIDGSDVYGNDFEPDAEASGEGFLSEQQLFVSDLVNHNATYEPGPDHTEENTMVYLENSVRNDTSVTVLAPSEQPGEWLSRLGISPVDTTSTTDDVVTKKPESPVMRYPNQLPHKDEDWYQWGTSWPTGDPPTPASWNLPSDFQQLTTVQGGKDDDATILTGMPYEDGGRVAAVTYNYSAYSDTELREKLYENLYTSSVYEDPTFSTDVAVPDDGTREIASDRRVMLVDVTPDGNHVVPLEITIWLWQN